MGPKCRNTENAEEALDSIKAGKYFDYIRHNTQEHDNEIHKKQK